LPILYRHIRQDKNEPFYIGIGESESRAYEKRGRTAAWKNIAKKGYDIEVLFDDLSWEQACEKEIEFIALYCRRDNKTGTLVNMTDGGEGTIGYKHSDITKEKCRVATSKTNHPFYNKKRPDHSEKMAGENNPCYGRTGENHPLFGKPGYWKDKNRQDKSKKVTYNGLEFVSQTALAKHLGKSKAYVTKLIKQNKLN